MKCSTTFLLSPNSSDEAFGRQFTKKRVYSGATTVQRCQFSAIQGQTFSRNFIGVKRHRTERFPSYRKIYNVIKFKENLIELKENQSGSIHPIRFIFSFFSILQVSEQMSRPKLFNLINSREKKVAGRRISVLIETSDSPPKEKSTDLTTFFLNG